MPKKKKKGKKKDRLARDMLAESMLQNMPPELIEQVLAELEAGRSMEDIMRALTDMQAPMRWAVSLFQEASVRLMKSVPLPPDVSDAQHEEEARKTKERVANDPTMSSLGFAHPENA